MRGKLELGNHKLAGIYRAPAHGTKHKRKRMPKMPGGTQGAYFMLWRIVDGAVRDSFERHPDYLTAKGQDSAQLSITKRVTGALMGYGAQASQCRSVQRATFWMDEADALPTALNAKADAAAELNAPSIGRRIQTVMRASATVGARFTPLRLWRWLQTIARNSSGANHEPD